MQIHIARMLPCLIIVINLCKDHGRILAFQLQPQILDHAFVACFICRTIILLGQRTTDSLTYRDRHGGA